MTDDFKELCEALDRHAAVADPARLDEVAHIEYCVDAGVIQSWCSVDRLRLILAELDAARRDAERVDALCDKSSEGTLTIRTVMRLRRPSQVTISYPGERPIGEGLTLREAIDAMKEQQP